MLIITSWGRENIRYVLSVSNISLIFRSHVIDYLDKNLKGPKKCMAYFYFDKNDPKSQDPLFVLQCLTKQVALQLSAKEELPPEPLAEAFEKYSGVGKLPPKLKDFADLFFECANKCDSVYVVLEAYNEYEEGQRDPLLPYLGRFVVSGVTKIYMTTRIQFQNFDPLKAIRLPIAAPATEISKFVQSQLNGKYDKGLEEMVVKVVTLNARGM